METIQFCKIKGYKNFKYFGEGTLKNTIEKLYNCSMVLWNSDTEKFQEKYKIDILENEKRFAYKLDENTMIIICRIKKCGETIGVIPLVLNGTLLPSMKGYVWNQLGSTLTKVMSECYDRSFFGSQHMLGEYLIKKIIANTFSKRGFDTNNIFYLIEYLQKLSATTFEDEYFKTGFIISRSLYAYMKKGNNDRKGSIIDLTSGYALLKENVPDKRLWYLVDGENSFLIFGKKLIVRHLFIKDKSDDSMSYFDTYSLSQTLLGQDIVFRVLSKSQYSILNADGLEFISIENRWKFRDYNVLANFFTMNGDFSSEIISKIIYFVMYCSHENKSVIIWLPNKTEEEEVKRYILSSNHIILNHLDILDAESDSLIKRMLTSDGVTAIDSDGKVIFTGGIVDLNSVPSEGKAIGTGESAARILSCNGIAIKISQDGAVKIFSSPEKNPLLF